ncbi:MAG TPA: serine/threonine-protein kinase [Candidatus Angelobacter sp.]
MDKQKAKQMTRELAGKTVGGWFIKNYINHGKSAVVFLAERGGQEAALKVFDPEIVERYGRDAQLTRIKRELSLIGKSHPNLVAIYDGGEDSGLLYVAMEYFPGSNLAEALNKIRPDEVRPLIGQIASGAKFLEDSLFAHRDIKPSNVGLSPDRKLVKLLDFGVIRPLDLSNVTDEGDQRYFVGTLQYSPPELLFREEEQSLEAWRAITFYQLGAILHDLLMKEPLFEKFKYPYARMVRAVEREIPLVDSSDDPDLRLLAQNCLAKAPNQRLDTVKWEDFSQPKITDPLEAARKRIAQHRVAAAQLVSQLGAPEDLLRMLSFAMRSSIYSTVLNTIKIEKLPRYSLLTVFDSNPYLLRVLFEPSASQGLQQYFSFYCQGAVLDPQANLHEVQLWACVTSARELIPAEPDPKASHVIVKGALIEQDIRMHIQQNLLLAYAEALDSPIAPAVSWLKIGSVP